MVLKSLLREVRNHFQLLKFQELWRLSNAGNATRAGNVFPFNVVNVGDHTYGTLNIHYYNQANEHLSIGSFCSIADDVHFYLGGEHNYRTLSTFPFKNRVTKNGVAESISKGPISIGNDVWIGTRTIILSGTKIGQGAVIGAGSVVSGTIPPYAIYAGGRIIKYRFSDSICKKLEMFDFTRLNWENINSCFDLLYTELSEENVNGIIEQLDYLRK